MSGIRADARTGTGTKFKKRPDSPEHRDSIPVLIIITSILIVLVQPSTRMKACAAIVNERTGGLGTINVL